MFKFKTSFRPHFFYFCVCNLKKVLQYLSEVNHINGSIFNDLNMALFGYVLIYPIPKQKNKKLAQFFLQGTNHQISMSLHYKVDLHLHEHESLDLLDTLRLSLFPRDGQDEIHRNYEVQQEFTFINTRTQFFFFFFLQKIKVKKNYIRFAYLGSCLGAQTIAIASGNISWYEQCV